MVFSETVGAPLSDSWSLHAIPLWNILGALPGTSLLKHVAYSDSQALAGARNQAGASTQAPVVLGPPSVVGQDMPCVDPSVIRSLQLEQRSRWSSFPRLRIWTQ